MLTYLERIYLYNRIQKFGCAKYVERVLTFVIVYFERFHDSSGSFSVFGGCFLEASDIRDIVYI
jgi:hypothetical protein